MSRDLDALLTLESRYTGPIPAEERWVLCLGSRAAYERARAKAAALYFSEQCARLIRTMKPSPALHDEIRRLLRERARWQGR